MKQMRAEGKPLLVALVPVAMLAVWAFARLGYVPPKPGETVTVNLRVPAAAIGGVAHVVPQDGLAAETGWIRRIVEDPERDASGKVNGLATWKLTAAGRPTPYDLVIRFGGRTVTRPLLVDGRRYAPVVELCDDGTVAVDTALTPYRPFGVIGGIPWIAFDPWLVGYLVLTIPFVFALRALFRIH